MAICDYCEKEMKTADGCTEAPIVIHGHPYPPVRFGSERYRWRLPRCGDCNVLPGQVHHHGCDIEECPACGEQSIGCGCRWAGEEDEHEEWEDEPPCWGPVLAPAASAPAFDSTHLPSNSQSPGVGTDGV